jgi:hypothetical protein
MSGLQSELRFDSKYYHEPFIVYTWKTVIDYNKKCVLGAMHMVSDHRIVEGSLNRELKGLDDFLGGWDEQ